MSIAVETKDCTALSEAELAELAELCAEGVVTPDEGVITKEAESWVLVSQARENEKLKGFAFCTLERIGGTPCILIGLGSIRRISKRETVLRAIVTEQMRRAVLAFPDEDVLVAARFAEPGAFDIFKSLHDIIPRPDHKVNGEERAWGRRLAKRYGVETNAYEHRQFRVNGDGSGPAPVFDYTTLHPDDVHEETAARFEEIHADKGDCLIAYGWAMEEDLRKFS